MQPGPGRAAGPQLGPDSFRRTFAELPRSRQRGSRLRSPLSFPPQENAKKNLIDISSNACQPLEFSDSTPVCGERDFGTFISARSFPFLWGKGNSGRAWIWESHQVIRGVWGPYRPDERKKRERAAERQKGSHRGGNQGGAILDMSLTATRLGFPHGNESFPPTSSAGQNKERPPPVPNPDYEVTRDRVGGKGYL